MPAPWVENPGASLVAFLWVAVVLTYWARVDEAAAGGTVAGPRSAGADGRGRAAAGAETRPLLWWVGGAGGAVRGAVHVRVASLALPSLCPPRRRVVEFQAGQLPVQLRDALAGVHHLALSSLPHWGDGLPKGLFLVPLAVGAGLLYLARRRFDWLSPGLRRRALPLGAVALGGRGAVCGHGAVGDADEHDTPATGTRCRGWH